jgi:dipeptidyl aminopeptidase/acylaminoacyl peptidase
MAHTKEGRHSISRPSQRSWPCVVLLSLGMALARPAPPHQLSPLPIEDMLQARDFETLIPISLSPQGDWIAYAVRDPHKSELGGPAEYARTGVPAYAKSAKLYILNLRTRETHSLKESGSADWAPAWSPDGRSLAFLSDRDGSGQAKVWLWEEATGKLRKLSDVAVRATTLEWMPGSQQLATTVLPSGMTPETYARHVLQLGDASAEAETGQQQDATVRVYRAGSKQVPGAPAAQSNPWSLEGYLADLALIDITTSEVQRLVSGKLVAKYVPSPSGSDIAFASPTRFEKPGAQQILWNLFVVTMAGHRMRAMASDIRMEYAGASFSWSPDSSALVFRTGGQLEMKLGKGDCYLVEMKTGVQRNITQFARPALTRESEAPLWSPDGRTVYFLREGSLWAASGQKSAKELARIADRRIVGLLAMETGLLWSPDHGLSTIVLTWDPASEQSGFYGVDLGSGQAVRLLERSQVYSAVSAADHNSPAHGSHILFLSQDSRHPNDLWLADARFERLERLTQLTPQLDHTRMGEARMVDWRSSDGETLRGALLLPAGFEKGKRYPLIVWIYGGARGSARLNYFGLETGDGFNLQLLATRGYAVLFPDAPQHLGTPMADLAKAVLPGVNKVIEMGIADPDRLGIIGHSYGGYSVLSLIVQTNRFKAAVVEDGAADLIASYGQMNADGAAFGVSAAEDGQELMGGTPWEFRDRYIENSPIFYLDRVATPLLILQGAEDKTVPPFLADEIFVGMRRLGKAVEYAKYAGESHSPAYWTYGNQLDFCRRVISWFDSHLR